MEQLPRDIRTLCDLRTAIAQDRIAVINQVVALAYLDLAEDALGDEFRLGLSAVDETAFEARFPEVPDTALTRAFGDGPAYARWRRNVLQSLCFAGLGDATRPFEKLPLFARRDGLRSPNRQVLERAFPGCHPREIRRGPAVTIDRGLRGSERHEFRASIRALDTLRAIDAVRACGVLTAETIGPFPDYADGDAPRVELPARLQGFADTLSVWDGRRIRRLFEIGVHAGILHAATDMSPADFVDARLLPALYEAAREKTSKATADTYLQSLFRTLQVSLPEALSTRLIMIDPRPGLGRDRRRARATRRAAREAPSPKRRGKSAAHPLPEFIAAALKDFEHATKASACRLKRLKSLLRRFATERPAQDLATLLEDATPRAEALLTRCAEATRVGYRRDLVAFLLHVGLADDWPALSRRASREFPELYCGRGIGLLARMSADHVPPLWPRDLSREIALDMASELRRTGQHNKVSRLNTGIAYLDRLRPLMPDLLDPEPIGPLPDARRGTHVALPQRLEHALKAHAAEAGFSDHGAKSMLIAVRTLYSVSRDTTPFDAPLHRIPFREILKTVAPAHATVMAPYRTEIEALAGRLSIAWTAGWRELQAYVVAAGISRSDNPVEALARIAASQNLDPWQLDREWAWTHERGLRPDLRLTFARNIARFDALRGIGAIAQAGLTPRSPLGPMPPRGSRLKNALLPLPPKVEAALEGETKQVLEAAHFLWCCLRAFGAYARGDDPAPGALMAEAHLAQVAAEQRIMTPASAKLHLARIRDWRESLRIPTHPVGHSGDIRSTIPGYPVTAR